MSDHTQELKEDPTHQLGCVIKCNDRHDGRHSYKEAGYNYLKQNKPGTYNIDFTKNPAKQRLDNSGIKQEQAHGKSRMRTPRDPRKFQNAWFIGTYQNFKKGFLPYNHDYHHMVPWDALQTVFTTLQLKLLQKATYNLNDGNNMIILPKGDNVGKAMLLPTHTDNHPGYTSQIIKRLERIKDKLQQQGHRVNESNKESVKKEIDENIEPKCFTEITGWGAGVGAGEDLGAVVMSL